MSFSPLSSVKQRLDDILEYVSRLSALASAVGVLSDVRVTPTGTVTVGGSLTAVTTVGTVSNQTQVGGYNANNHIPALMNMEATIANIDNIIIS